MTRYNVQHRLKLDNKGGKHSPFEVARDISLSNNKLFIYKIIEKYTKLLQWYLIRIGKNCCMMSLIESYTAFRREVRIFLFNYQEYIHDRVQLL